jgi:hypothetical protein
MWLAYDAYVVRVTVLLRVLVVTRSVAGGENSPPKLRLPAIHRQDRCA